MSATERRKLLTVVAEAVLEESLVATLGRMGVSGWTITDARGRGSRGRRSGEIPGANVRIETLVGAETAALILDALAERFFADYAIVAWITDVDVVRGDKYP